ncbi:hypothetical protein J2W97_001297 [Paenibacillus jamilae]|nr:hypothetical protein [Paenibacillus jamilae]
MWKKYLKDENGDYGFVKLISDDYTTWRENAEVILVDHFPKVKDGETKVLLSRRTIRFTQFFGSGDIEEEFEELKTEYVLHYGKEPTDVTDMAFFCADGWSRWSADERIENPSEEAIKEYLKKHGVLDNYK